MATKEGEQIHEIIREFAEGQETVFDFLEEGGESIKRVEIARRILLPEQPTQPAIARRKARAHEFHSLSAFCDYVKRWGDKEATLILADSDKRSITCVLGEHSSDPDEELDQEIVSLKAIEHPLFTPWSRLLDKPIAITEFALFCMKYRSIISEPNGKELALIFSQVKMSKSVEMRDGVGKKSINGVMVTVEIAGEKKGVPVELPETIAIECPLFVGTGSQRIEIDLLVTNLRDDSIVVYCTAPTVEAQRIESFECMVGEIKEQTGFLVGLGVVSHREWNTVTQVKHFKPDSY